MDTQLLADLLEFIEHTALLDHEEYHFFPDSWKECDAPSCCKALELMDRLTAVPERERWWVGEWKDVRAEQPA